MKLNGDCPGVSEAALKGRFYHVSLIECLMLSAVVWWPLRQRMDTATEQSRTQWEVTDMSILLDSSVWNNPKSIACFLLQTPYRVCD